MRTKKQKINMIAEAINRIIAEDEFFMSGVIPGELQWSDIMALAEYLAPDINCSVKKLEKFANWELRECPSKFLVLSLQCFYVLDEKDTERKENDIELVNVVLRQV